MCFIIGRELKYCFRQPIFYIGIILVLFYILFYVNPYLGITYYEKDKKFTEVSEDKRGDVEIYDGYIPAENQEKFDLALKKIYDTMLKMGYDEEEAKEAVKEIKDEDMSVEQIDEFMSSKYKMHDAANFFQRGTDYRLGTSREVNAYIKQKLSQENYTKYLGRKYADYMSVAAVFFSMILFAVLCVNEYKRDIYEVLHTKPIKSYKLILGKAIGGILADITALSAVTFIFDIISMIKCSQSGFPANFGDVWFYFIICIWPAVICMGCLSIFITGIFKTSLPTIPIFFLWLIYSNLGKRSTDGVYGYVQKPFSIVTRFPANFFETTFSNDILLIQGVLIIMAIIVSILAVIMWNRRKLL